jgi:hypothetical protein
VRHLSHSDQFKPQVFFSTESIPVHSFFSNDCVTSSYDPYSADILFLAGNDWQALADYPGIHERVPIVNLIQGFRHLNQGSTLFPHLKKPATRICVSPELFSALSAPGVCNGPIYLIRPGINIPEFKGIDHPKSVDVFIAGLKNTELAKSLEVSLVNRGLTVDSLIQYESQTYFHDRMTRARICCFLPYPEEGFYLPALEAMAMGATVVCPDCRGNRSFCINEVTALVPDYSLTGLVNSVVFALSNTSLCQSLSENGVQMAQQFSLEAERDLFLQILLGLKK